MEDSSIKFYDKYILPHVVHLACKTNSIQKQREKVVPFAEGRVLEIGIGSGLNLPLYNAEKVTRVWGVEPSAEMRAKAREAADKTAFEVEFLNCPGEDIPLENNSADTVLMTYTLCTIPDAFRALKEMRRILKPGCRLIFCEHGLAPDENVARWQHRITPVWKKFAGGCHLNRAIPQLIEQGGFRIRKLETMYIPTWKPAGFNYWGMAEKA